MPACSSCGAVDDVRTVTFDLNGRDVAQALCPSCKGDLLERRRVRMRHRRRGPGPLARLGYALIVLGLLGLLALVVLGALAVTSGDDEDSPGGCQMTDAGFDCDR